MFLLCLAQDSAIIKQIQNDNRRNAAVERTKYKNEHMKEHYDKINFIVPKGEKEKIKAIAQSVEMSMSEYLYALVKNDNAAGESKLGKKKQGFNEEKRRMLEKWQVPKKYHEMIEDLSYSKEEGYFIYLKAGYVNDITCSRSIQCEKTSEVRRIIVKSHKK